MQTLKTLAKRVGRKAWEERITLVAAGAAAVAVGLGYVDADTAAQIVMDIAGRPRK